MRLSALSGALAVLLFVYSDRCNLTLHFVWPPSSNALQVTVASAIAESRRLLTTRHKGKKEEDGLGLVGSRETTAQLQYIVPVLDLQLPVDVFNFPGRRQWRRRRSVADADRGDEGTRKRKEEERGEGGGRRAEGRGGGHRRVRRGGMGSATLAPACGAAPSPGSEVVSRTVWCSTLANGSR